MKKRIIISLFCLGILLPCVGQNRSMVFEYDAAGNLVVKKMKVVILQSMKQKSVVVPEIITEQMAERKIKLYPNPTRGNLSLEITNGNTEEEYTAWVYTAAGKLLIEKKHTGNGTILFDFESYPTGYYLLNLRVGNETLQYKIIKE